MQKSDVLLEIRNIQASYKEYPALNNVSLDIKKNTVLGLVGESGSGKSTLAKVITGLLQADTGEVVFDGEMLYSKKKHLHRKQQCKQIQMVFQNPEGSLNPKHTIEKILSDAMLFHKVTDRAHVKEKCQEWVQRMELPEDTLSRFPSSFSGGQKQRIALARALCVSPKFLIADEPTSALDVSVQLRMLQLIKELKREMGLTILFISHDMGVIYDICDEVAVMKDGKWIFENSQENHSKIRFGDLFQASMAIATQRNKVFVVNETEKKHWKLERGAMRLALSPRNQKYGNKEYIIFPYMIRKDKVINYSEELFKRKYPNAYAYLLKNKKELGKRDADKSAQWFEYGRSQALQNMNKKKLLISTVVTNEVNTYETGTKSIPYAGIYVISEKGYDLKIAKKILESEEFLKYVHGIGTPASGKSLRITAKDINEFTFLCDDLNGV